MAVCHDFRLFLHLFNLQFVANESLQAELNHGHVTSIISCAPWRLKCAPRWHTNRNESYLFPFGRTSYYV